MTPYRVGAAQLPCPGSSRARPRSTRTLTSPSLGELERIGKEVLQHLAQAARGRW